MKNGIYIPSIDAKDIYIAANYINSQNSFYSLKDRNGKYILKKFINSFNNSLDLPIIKKAYKKKYRANNFSFREGKHEYTVHIINLTFKYSVKKWNNAAKNMYIKFGYNNRNLKFVDNIARNAEGELVGIITDKPVDSPCSCEELPKNIKVKTTENGIVYKKTGEFETLKTSADLRHWVYENGFICDGIKYCRMKRSSGAARVGRCLFINENLYKPLINFCSKGIDVHSGDEIDLAAYEAYISLTSSSIIGTLKILPENILVIDDYISKFQEDVIVTRNKNGRLVTTEETCDIENDIWDGQSLIDISAMDEYKNHGMVLLRNLMFKSCCFNCNIQRWFKDNGITDIKQLKGQTRAKRIEDIKLITTSNSIKYLKFGSLEQWFDNIYEDFGVVKHDKPTHFFEGRMVQTHYQLLNTLQLSPKDVSRFLQESFDFAKLLKNEPAVVRYYIKYQYQDSYRPVSQIMKNKFDVIYFLMGNNNRFVKTKYYNDFLKNLLKSYYKNLKNGHVFVNGNYSTLLGNPIEMLQAAIGKFEGVSQIGIGNIHSKRFRFNKVLLGSRSPHVTMGNILLAKNTKNKEIDKYLNLTQEVVCINSIGENILQRLSGAD